MYVPARHDEQTRCDVTVGSEELYCPVPQVVCFLQLVVVCDG